MSNHLVILLALAAGACLADAPIPSVETRPHDLDCLVRSGHVQGACCSEKGFYLSHSMGIDSFDWKGRHLKHADAPSHLGDSAYADGKVYGAFCLRDEAAKKYGTRGLIRVWNEDLEVVAEKPVDALLDGAVVFGGTLYVGVDKWGNVSHSNCCIRAYDLDLNFKEEKEIELGYPIVFGIQTMATDGKELLIGNYGGNSRFSPDWSRHRRIRWQKGFRIAEGFGAVPEAVFGRKDVFFTVNALGGNMKGWRKDPANNPPRIRIKFYTYKDGNFTFAGDGDADQ